MATAIKEAWQKEREYGERWNAGRINGRDLWRYVPQKVAEGVTDIFADSDGYWVWLDHEDGGWVAYDGAEDCGMIHEYTIADLRDAIKTIRRGR